MHLKTKNLKKGAAKMANKNIFVQVLFHQLIETISLRWINVVIINKQKFKSYVMISILNLNLYAATKVM